MAALPKVFFLAAENYAFSPLFLIAAALLLPGCETKPQPAPVSVQQELRSRYRTAPRKNIALERFEAAVQSGLVQADMEVYCDAAGAYFMRGEYSKAMATYQQALELEPDGVRPLYNLGRVYQRLGKTDEAIRCFSRIVELAPEFADGYLSLGAAYAQRAPVAEGTPTHVFYTDLEKAVEYCAKAVALEPENAFFRYNLARAYHVNNQSSEAAGAYRRVLELDPDRAVAHKHLGAIYAKQANSAEAITEYHRAIRLDSTDAEVYFLLGKMLDRQGKYEEAVASYKRALKLNPDVPEVHYNLGKAYHRLGRQEEGQQEMEIFESLKDSGGDLMFSARMEVQRKPGSAAPHRDLGVVYAQAGQYDRAIEELRVALSLDPDMAPQIYHDMGLIHARSGADRKAVEVLEKAVALAPDTARFHLRLGQIYAKVQRNPAAVEAFKRAIELDPGLLRGRYELAMLYVRDGQHSEAVGLFQQVLEAEPHHVEARYGLSLAYLNTAHYPEAIEGFEQVLALQPDHPGARRFSAVAKQRIEAR